MSQKTVADNKLIYLIHKHQASHLHYDLRLEESGVLKSYALPKEPPTRPGEKRLAIQVEDHPLSYADFEGLIPEGQYGAGQVEIWDRGYYLILEKNEKMKEMLILGKKLSGVYTLVKIKDKENKASFLTISGQNLDRGRF